MAEPGRSYSVLLVEDDPATAQLVMSYLGGHGVRVERAADGRRAWELFQRTPPDLVLTDLMLPWLSGAELVRLIRGHPRGRNIPMVVISAAVNASRADDVQQQLPVQHVLPKPLVLRELLACLDECVRTAVVGDGAPLPTVAAAEAVVQAARATGVEPDLMTGYDVSPDASRPNAPGAIAAVLLAVQQRRRSGILQVRDHEGMRRILVYQGVIVGADSGIPAEGLATLLMEACALDPQRAAIAARAAHEEELPFALAVQRVMNVAPWVVASAVQGRVRSIVWRALASREGAHQLVGWEMVAALQTSVRLDAARTVQQSVLHALPDDAIAQDAERLAARPLAPAGVLAAAHAVLAELLAESGQAVEVPPTGPWPATLGAALQGVGAPARRQWLALHLATHGVTSPDKAPSVPFPTGGADWVSETTSDEERFARDDVGEEFLRTYRRAAAAVLEVSADAPAANVRYAASVHQDRFGPPAMDDAPLGPARSALEVVRARRDAAEIILVDPDERARHDAWWEDALAARVQRAPPAPPPDLVSLPPAADDRGGRGLEDFDIRERFAVGGTAELFRARDRRSGRDVVLKRLRADRTMDIPAVTGFIRECDVALMLCHANVVHGLARLDVGGEGCLVLEWVDGPDLERAWNAVDQRTRDAATGLWTHVVTELLLGLDHAHHLRGPDGRELGLVHRDLAPRNILLGRDGAVKVTDFGACVYSASEMPPMDVVGSAGFLSPEQARLEVLDARSDVFAAGCMLYQLVCGRPAFTLDGTSDGDVLRLHQRGRIRPVPRTVPAPLRAVIEAATSPAREDRFSTARAMSEALSHARAEVGFSASASELGDLVARVSAR